MYFFESRITLILLIAIVFAPDPSLSMQCFHCSRMGGGVCRHPEHFYPPITDCGSGNFVCAEVNAWLYPALDADLGQVYLSFEELPKQAEFKGCVLLDYCNTVKKRMNAYTNIGAYVNKCRVCEQDLCNLTTTSLSFASKVKLSILAIVHFLSNYVFNTPIALL